MGFVVEDCTGILQQQDEVLLVGGRCQAVPVETSGVEAERDDGAVWRNGFANMKQQNSFAEAAQRTCDNQFNECADVSTRSSNSSLQHHEPYSWRTVPLHYLLLRLLGPRPVLFVIA